MGDDGCVEKNEKNGTVVKGMEDKAVCRFRQAKHCMEPMSLIHTAAWAAARIMVSIPLPEVSGRPPYPPSLALGFWGLPS